ncbi:hypothetical protein [Mucilaginibacter sp. KACC 22063]|uniref:hypothetical protein n=1 Tax=Mucilaginibacter sp. KACC 22063 TaxID=3025666 RepID=UPI002365DE8E|nr:hypothetical protein [Mucilaginibacter sp. KACC 22063]WDF57248.1 hypothetical protein PQ461_09305 [Mucilaginibacter sp. KACC 22063]
MQLIKLMVKRNANNEQLLEVFGLFEIENIKKLFAPFRMLRPNPQKYFYHTSLHFSPNENLGDEQ